MYAYTQYIVCVYHNTLSLRWGVGRKQAGIHVQAGTGVATQPPVGDTFICLF